MTPRAPRPDRRSRHLQAVPSAGSTHPQGSPEDFLGTVGAALDDPDPLAFLSLASMIICSTGRLDYGSPEHEDYVRPPQELFYESMLNISARETTAMLHAIAALSSDNRVAQQARREIRRRDHAVPHWLETLDDAQAEATATTLDHFRDGENVVVTVRLSDGSPLTSVLYVDFNIGFAAKDGFVLPEDAEGFRQLFHHAGDPAHGIEYLEITPGEAQARIMDAIESGDHVFPPLESEMWPHTRPLIEWMAGLLPGGGGEGYRVEEVSPIQRQRLLQRFLSSPSGRGLDGEDDPVIAELLITFLTDYTVGDPLRWSPVKVEILLGDWFPRKVMFDSEAMRRMPAVLRAMVQFGHQELGLPAHATEDTLRSVEEWTPYYLKRLLEADLAAGEERAEDWAEACGSAGGFAGGEGWPGYPYGDDPGLVDSQGNPISFELHRAVELVGGEEALAALDAEPLPDEELQLDRVSEDILGRVQETTRLCDEAADALFDQEIRTACRRVIAQTAAEEPGVFRRKSKDVTAAAAVLWAVATVNNRMGLYSGWNGPMAKDLTAHFGTAVSYADRARPFLRSFGGRDYQRSTDLSFATPAVLTGARRAALIRLRDAESGANGPL